MPGEVIVDSLGIRLGERAGPRREPGHFVARRAGEAELPHEDIDSESLVVVFQAFAEPALTDDPDEQHLDEPVMRMKEAQPALQVELVVPPNLDDSARRAPRAKRASGDFKRAESRGDAQDMLSDE